MRASAELLVQWCTDPEKVDDWLGAGLLSLSSQDFEYAHECFEAAHAGASVDSCQAALAAALFARANQCIADKEYAKAEAALERIKKEYAATAWFAANKQSLSHAGMQVEAGLRDIKAERLYKDAAEAFNAMSFSD